MNTEKEGNPVTTGEYEYMFIIDGLQSDDAFAIYAYNPNTQDLRALHTDIHITNYHYAKQLSKTFLNVYGINLILFSNVMKKLEEVNVKNLDLLKEDIDGDDPVKKEMAVSLCIGKYINL